MRLGIDWVSVGLFVVAYAISQVGAIPVPVRYGALSGACALIAILRLRMGAVGVNLIFVGVAAALAVYYAVRAMRARGPGA